MLAVIGIIALLISILLPSLNRARQSAQLVACSSLLRQIGIATRNYGIDNKDALPPVMLDDGQLTINYSAGGSAAAPAGANPNLPFLRSVAWPYWLNGSAGAEMSSPTIGASIGRLVCKGYMKGEFQKLVQCPSGDVFPGNGNNCYVFNAHLAIRNGYLQPMWYKLSKYGKLSRGVQTLWDLNAGATVDDTLPGNACALGGDPMVASSGTSTLGANPHLLKNGRGYDLLYADGSVQTAIVPNTIQRNSPNSAARFVDFLTYLEGNVGGQGSGASAVFGTPGKKGRIPYNPSR